MRGVPAPSRGRCAAYTVSWSRTVGAQCIALAMKPKGRPLTRAVPCRDRVGRGRVTGAAGGQFHDVRDTGASGRGGDGGIVPRQFGSRRQEEDPVRAREHAGQPVGLAQVAAHDFDTRGQTRGGRTPGDGPYPRAQRAQLLDHEAADGPGGSGDDDHEHSLFADRGHSRTSARLSRAAHTLHRNPVGRRTSATGRAATSDFRLYPTPGHTVSSTRGDSSHRTAQRADQRGLMRPAATSAW